MRGGREQGEGVGGGLQKLLWSCERRGAALRESKAAQNTKVGGRKGALYIFIFIISILKTNYFFFPAEKGEEEGGEEEGLRFLPLFSLCFLSSLLLIFQQM